MAEASDSESILRQNLVDAGCGPEVVNRCMELARRKETAELMRALSLHRQLPLDTFHQSEKQIDCLDYLIYRLKKQKNPEVF